MSLPLWTPDEIAAATGARVVGRLSAATGVSIDTRTLEPGDLFFAIKGDVHDGHGFVRDALAKGAAAAVVAEDRAAELAGAGPLLVAPDVLDAMRRLGIAARRRSNATIVAVTGSVGKTGTKEAMRLAFERLGSTHASVASYNNHWGVPLTLARLPRDAAYGVFEIGMNHAGEIEPLTRMVRPHVAVITTVEPVHIEFFRSISAIADAKGEIFCGIEPGGTAVLNRDNASFERVRAHALASAAGRVVSFGEHASADVRAERIILQARAVGRRGAGARRAARLPGRRARAPRGDELACGARRRARPPAAISRSRRSASPTFAPPAGRGERIWLSAAGGDFLLVDESLQRQPGLDARRRLRISPRPSLGRAAAASRSSATCSSSERRDRRCIASSRRRWSRAAPTSSSPPDRLMTHLVEGLPPERRGGYAASAAELEAAVLANVRAGDVVMVKGSKGILVSRIVKALKERYGAGARPRRREGLTRMLTYLAEFSSLFSPFNVFRYITFRTGGATATALLFVFWFGPAIISALRLKQGKGQPIREDGPQSHLLTKRGTPTMGGLMILSGTLVATLLWANPRNLYVWVRDLRDARLRRHRLLRRLSQGDEAVAQGLFGKVAARARGGDRRSPPAS